MIHCHDIRRGGRKKMIRIDGFYLYTVGAAIRELNRITVGSDFKSSLLALYIADNTLQTFVSNSVYKFKAGTLLAANELLSIIRSLTSTPDRDTSLNPY